MDWFVGFGECRKVVDGSGIGRFWVCVGVGKFYVFLEVW